MEQDLTPLRGDRDDTLAHRLRLEFKVEIAARVGNAFALLNHLLNAACGR